MNRAIVFAAISAFALASYARADQSSAAGSAGGPQAVVHDASSAFEFLKTLAGDWERSSGDHQHGSKSRATTFKLTAAGSSVLETIFPGDQSEMLTVYHMDGDDLLLTHYCALHNAPIMKFEKSNQPGEIKFIFLGGTNFDPKVDTHVHEGTFRIKDANTLETSFVTFSDGKADASTRGILKRKQPK